MSIRKLLNVNNMELLSFNKSYTFLKIIVHRKSNLET